MRSLSVPLGLLLAAVSLFAMPASLAAAQSPAGAAPSTTGPGTVGEATETASARVVDPSSFLGATLSQVLETFGAPKTVHSVRGPEAWQDDVVFVYEDLDVYWFRDRVWQVRADSAYGLKAGDTRELAISLLGEPLHRLEDAFVYQLPSRAWPIRLRVGFDAEGRLTKLFVYRADF